MGGGVTWMKFPNLHRKACFSKPTSFVVGGDKFNKKCFTRNWMKFQTSTNTVVANPPPLWGWKVGKDDFSHGVEGWQIWHLCRSWNFIQFLAKKHIFLHIDFCPNLLGVANMTFLFRSRHSIQFLVINNWHLAPYLRKGVCCPHLETLSYYAMTI